MAGQKKVRVSAMSGTAEAPRRSIGPKKSEQTRQRILDAAAHVFSQRGYALAYLKDIAKEAGTPIGNLYYYFESREAIVEEILNKVTSEIDENVRRDLAAAPETANLAERLSLAIRSHLRWLLAHRNSYLRAYLMVIDQIPEEIRNRHLPLPRAYGDLWRELVQSGRAGGQIREDLDLTVVRLLIIGSLNYSLRWFRSGRMSVEQVAEQAATIFLNGILQSGSGEAVEPARGTVERDRAEARDRTVCPQLGEGSAPGIFGISGKGALVIGGGLGMGESTALALAGAGCRVAVLDVDAERAAKVADKIKAGGGHAVSFTADVLDDHSLTSAIRSAREQIDDLEILVAIVGSAHWSPLTDLTPEAWDREMRLNLRYFFIAAQEFATSLLRQNRTGSIVCVSSVSGLQSAPLHAAYGAAKAGLINLVRTMAVEWSPHGIRVNAIAPGTIITPRRPGSAERAKMISDSLIPMRRSGQTDDIANAALYLSSQMAAYVTGHTLVVDGGWLAANVLIRGEANG